MAAHLRFVERGNAARASHADDRLAVMDRGEVLLKMFFGVKIDIFGAAFEVARPFVNNMILDSQTAARSRNTGCGGGGGGCGGGGGSGSS